MNHRIILVTGGNGGLGQAIGRAFLQESPNNRVLLAVRQNRNHADALAGEFPGRGKVIELDVTEPEAWRRCIGELLQEWGRIDVLVNNAGRHEDSLLALLSESAWRSVLQTNLDAAFYGCQAVLPAMISQRHGRIINVASLSALLAPAGQSNYAAAKAGLLAMGSSLAKEVARIGITVNSICPGYIATDALESMGEDGKKAALARIPMRRFGRPEEVAASVLFLACPEAAYITGSYLKIDGGIL